MWQSFICSKQTKTIRLLLWTEFKIGKLEFLLSTNYTKLQCSYVQNVRVKNAADIFVVAVLVYSRNCTTCLHYNRGHCSRMHGVSAAATVIAVVAICCHYGSSGRPKSKASCQRNGVEIKNEHLGAHSIDDRFVREFTKSSLLYVL